MKKILIILLCFLMLIPTIKAEDLAPNSRSAILMEASTGTILYQKNIHEKLAPASMTKLMTMLLVMEAIEAGKVQMDDLVLISDNASRMGGSQIFLQIGSRLRVSELLKGVAIASANDASVALAEKIAGTESKFVELMNERVRELGLRNTNFKNSHGLDDADHYSTAHDMAVISRELVRFEELLNFTRIYEEHLNKPDGTSTWMVNTNRLVRFFEGMDGLKTGFTTTAGYCLSATAKRGNLRLISVVMKVDTPDMRSSDTTRLLNAGFNGWRLNMILERTKEIGSIRVENGKKELVELQLLDDVTELQKVTDDIKKYELNVKTKRVKAPVKVGDIVGTLELIYDGEVVKEVPLTVKEDVRKANIFNMIIRNFRVIISGKNLLRH